MRIESHVVQQRQEFRSKPEFSPKTKTLESLVTDLQAVRDRMIRSERRRRSGVLAGQFLILARQYASRPPSRKTLKNFFHLIAREAA